MLEICHCLARKQNLPTRMQPWLLTADGVNSCPLHVCLLHRQLACSFCRKWVNVSTRDSCKTKLRARVPPQMHIRATLKMIMNVRTSFKQNRRKKPTAKSLDGHMKQLSIFPTWVTRKTFAFNVTSGQDFSYEWKNSHVNNKVLLHTLILEDLHMLPRKLTQPCLAPALLTRTHSE